jgi:hypothetical protein
MKVVFDIINPSGIVTNEEIKSVLSAAMCHEIFMGRCVPDIVHLKLVKYPIRRLDVVRSGELRYVVGRPTSHRIVVHYNKRTRDEILNTVFHETCHLLRVYNKENNSDLELEEKENRHYMTKINNLVEWVSLILMAHTEGSLGGVGEKN